MDVIRLPTLGSAAYILGTFGVETVGCSGNKLYFIDPMPARKEQSHFGNLVLSQYLRLGTTAPLVKQTMRGEERLFHAHFACKIGIGDWAAPESSSRTNLENPRKRKRLPAM